MSAYETLMWALVALLCALSAFDAISTEQAFKKGAREANPIMASIQKLFPTEWPLIRGVLGLAVAALALASPQPWGAVVAAVACAVWGYAVYNNYKIAWGK